MNTYLRPIKKATYQKKNLQNFIFSPFFLTVKVHLKVLKWHFDAVSVNVFCPNYCRRNIELRKEYMLNSKTYNQQFTSRNGAYKAKLRIEKNSSLFSVIFESLKK